MKFAILNKPLTSGATVQYQTSIQTQTFENWTEIRSQVRRIGGTKPVIQSSVWLAMRTEEPVQTSLNHCSAKYLIFKMNPGCNHQIWICVENPTAKLPTKHTCNLDRCFGQAISLNISEYPISPPRISWLAWVHLLNLLVCSFSHLSVPRLCETFQNVRKPENIVF